MFIARNERRRPPAGRRIYTRRFLIFFFLHPRVICTPRRRQILLPSGLLYYTTITLLFSIPPHTVIAHSRQFFDENNNLIHSATIVKFGSLQTAERNQLFPIRRCVWFLKHIFRFYYSRWCEGIVISYNRSHCDYLCVAEHGRRVSTDRLKPLIVLSWNFPVISDS